MLRFSLTKGLRSKHYTSLSVYRQYTPFSIFPFVFQHCLRSTQCLLYIKLSRVIVSLRNRNHLPSRPHAEMNKHVEWKFGRITINDNGKTSPKGKCFHNHLSFRLPNFHKCFYNAMETQKLCLIPISFIK